MNTMERSDENLAVAGLENLSPEDREDILAFSDFILSHQGLPWSSKMSMEPFIIKKRLFWSKPEGEAKAYTNYKLPSGKIIELHFELTDNGKYLFTVNEPSETP